MRRGAAGPGFAKVKLNSLLGHRTKEAFIKISIYFDNE